MSYPPIAILGAGSWGTALALLLSRRGQPVRIWSIETSEITAMQTDRANTRYLPGHPLPDCLEPMTELSTTVAGAEDILMVVPSVGFRQTLTSIKPLITPQTRIICATKGLDSVTNRLLNEVSAEVLGPNHPFAVLSGPSFAKEVAAGQPTAVVVASQQPAVIAAVIQRFQCDIFRVEPSDDVVGVELGGILKNVIAIATGIVDGMHYGTNTRSAMITLGLHEMQRLGTAMGAKPETLVGLSGLGDLILTCSDDQSRNRRLGLYIGSGMTAEAAEKKIGQVVEGKQNAALVHQLAMQHQVNMPICQAVWKVLHGEADKALVIQCLMMKAE